MPEATQQRRTTVGGRCEIRCDRLIHARTTQLWLRPRRSQPSEIVWRRCLREWIPPPNLDWGHLPACKGDGQTRVNNYHYPERYLIPDEEIDDG
jgi:hypothetical protein